MRILTKLEKNRIKIKIENLSDLWVLSTLVNKEDIVRAKTIRKINLQNDNDQKSKIVKKQVYLGLKTEKVDFEESKLKILGTILEGPEDIPKGSHHSFNLEVNDKLEIEKNWLKYELEKIKKSCNKQDLQIIACLFDREEAIIAKLRNSFFVKVLDMKGQVEKKGFPQNSDNFYSEIVKKIIELDQRNSLKVIILASSNFWKSEMKKEIEKTNLNDKVIYTTINSVNESSFPEILSKDEVVNAMKDVSAVQDMKIINDFFKTLSKQEPCVYGINDVKKGADQGAIKMLICTDDFIKEKREKDKFQEVEEIFRLVESSDGEVHIFSGKSDAVKRLNGLGGIAGFVRFQIF